MDRVFLDANILFSAAYRAGAGCASLWSVGGISLLTSRHALAEARRHLDDDQRVRLEFLMRRVQLVPEAPTPALPAGVVLRDEDAPILAAAIQGKATHLITGDLRDSGPYFGRRLGGVLVLRPRDYLGSKRGRAR